MSKVSIIISVYNSEKYLKKCLDSAVQQEFEDFDIICVDDHSIDGSLEILSEYEKQYGNITVIKNDSNRGVAYCRNRAIERAKSEYVLFLDSDDWFERDTLKITYEQAVKDQLDMVIFQMKLLYENSNLEKNFETYTKKSKYPTGSISNGIDMLRDSNGWLDMRCTSKLISLKMLRDNGIYFTEGYVHEDNAYSLKLMLAAKRIKVIDDALYVYLRRNNSITTVTNEVQRLKGNIVAYADMMRLLLGKYHDDQDAARILAQILDRKYNFIISDYPDIKSYGEVEFDNPYYQHIYHCLKQSQGLFSKDEIEYFKKFEQIIIYGAGKLGKRVLRELRELNVVGFAVSAMNGNTSIIENIPVKTIDEYADYKETALVIIAIVSDERREIKELLVEQGFGNVYIGVHERG